MSLSVTQARPRGTIFRVAAYEGVGWGSHSFDTSQAINVKPTGVLYFFDGYPKMRWGVINRIVYYMKPTAVETYTLRLWNNNTDPAIDAGMDLLSALLFQSAALKAGATRYEENNLNIPFKLITPGKMFYSLEWTGAPGITPGFIYVHGISYDLPIPLSIQTMNWYTTP